MLQRTLHRAAFPGWHVAIIMDGNGRWATRRGRPRSEGHRAGAEALRRVVEAAPRLGIGTLSLFAFSAQNWERPAHEVAALMQIFREHLKIETPAYVERGVRLSVMGRRDRLAPDLRAAIEASENATASGSKLHLRLAMDYSAREAILRAACRLYTSLEVSQEAFARLLDGMNASAAMAPDVDLTIRTGGEQRLSDFLLWECAFAELYFTPRLWPDFEAADLAAAVREFRARERRFGRLPAAVAS